MADNSLPKAGVQAVVQDADRYFAVLDKMEQATSKLATTLEKQADKTVKAAQKTSEATKAMNPLAKILDKLDDQFGGVGKKVMNFADEMGFGADKVAMFAEGLGVSTTALLAVAAAGVVAIGVFVSLGQRGAGLVGLAESFDRLNQKIGVDAVASLQRLREAAGGTVADFDLIRLTNLALAGSVGVFGQQFAQNLPRILEIARVQARATGQSVDFLFQSLITGIKRGSPLLIDNTGLVLKISEANEAMALSLGKSVEQLTAEEKQLAVLNATLAAGQTAIDAFAGMQETSADKLARMNATITNILDTLAVGVQPAFGMFLDVINRALGFVQILTTALNPLISSLLEMAAAIMTGPVTAVQALIEPVVKLIGWFITLATAILQPVIRAVTTVFQTIGTAVQRIVDFIGGALASIGLTFDTMALSVGVGAGAIIAAMGNAMLQAYNAVIAPVVLFIATSIADFLVGQSPPPKGPLSKIDKGGAATMMAWMEGFAGVSLEPVNQVAASVSATLGSIGAFTLPQVEARIGMLDQALEPFNSQLEIIKANFEAINTPAQAALEAIDRQLAKAQEALDAGVAGSAEKVRALDAQREMIEKAVSAQQELVDQAQIQQALAKSQQAPERALLAIQQARLKAMEAKPTKEGKEAAAAASAAGKGAAPTPEVAAAGGNAGGFDMSLPGVADLISGQRAVDQMGADLGAGFTAGFEGSINQGALAQAQNFTSQISAQGDRIASANIGERISSAFSGIATSVQTALQEARSVIDDWIGGITDPSREGSIPYSFNALASGDWSALGQSLSAPFEDLATNVRTAVVDTVSYLSDPANEESIVASLNAFAEGLPEFMQPLVTGFADNFGLIRDNIMLWLDETLNPDNINSIPGTLALLPTRVENALRSLGDSFNNSVLVPIQDTVTNVGLAVANFFVGTGEGSLKGMLDAGVAWFMELPTRIFNALASLGQVFFAVFVSPMVGGINLAIEALEQFVNGALSGLGTLIGSLQGVADAIGMGDQLAEITSSLVGGINLPRVAMPTAPAAQLPGAARGGIFSSGLMRAGERGTEIIGNAASKTAVFPANVTRDLDVLARVLGGGGSMPLPLLANGGGNSTSNTTFNQNFNLAQPASSGNAMQQISTMMAMRKR